MDNGGFRSFEKFLIADDLFGENDGLTLGVQDFLAPSPVDDRISEVREPSETTGTFFALSFSRRSNSVDSIEPMEEFINSVLTLSRPDRDELTE